MKISYQWLCEYLELNKTPQELEEALTLIGFEVEGIEIQGLPDLPNVVVGEILSREQHPNADRLGVCQVRVSPTEEPRQIVCGATNYKVGDRVPVALPGAVLPGDFKIKSSKLRGVKSDGMMCSPRELGLGNDHQGLMILDQRPEIGMPINEVYPDRDFLIDIEVTPNRPDCLSHLGIARELAAYFNLELTYPNVNLVFPSGNKEFLVGKVDVQSNNVCPYYLLYSIKGVTVKESPEWLKKRLQAIGLRSINNVVDITNYVLHELGQPLHAFDADKIRGNKLIIRQARQSEKIVTLDEKERVLQNYMTVIADEERSLVIAGVMGSIDAEVDANTRNIVLESAWFQPAAIRQTSRRLGLSTDSSYRFERRVDPEGVEFAASRAIELILEVAGGTLLGGVHQVGHAPDTRTEIEISQAYVNKVLGFSIPAEEIVSIFERLELSVVEKDGNNGRYWLVGIPSFRADLDRPIDLVEEILRIYGTPKIPPARVQVPGLLQEDDPVHTFVVESADYLKGLRFSECVNYTLRSEQELERYFTYSYAANLKLANPLAQDQTHLRPSLLLGLFDNIRYNIARGNQPRGVFETGRTFKEVAGKIYEMVSVAFVVYQPEKKEDSWHSEPEATYYHAKHWIEDLLKLAGVHSVSGDLIPMESGRPWSEGHSAILGGFQDGWQAKFGYLGAAILKQWEIPGKLLAGALHIMPERVRTPKKFPRYKAVSAYPAVDKDISLLVDAGLWASQVEAFLTDAAKKALPEGVQLEQVELFDIFQGKGVPEGKKSLTYNLSFRSAERTLTDDEINAVYNAVRKAVEQHSEYTLRT